MAFVNARVEIRLGNVESRLVGPVPGQRLDREMNPPRLLSSEPGSDPALVYHPVQKTFLTGALPEMKRQLRRAGYLYRIRDLRQAARRREEWRLDGPPLRDYQRDVVERAIRAERGIIDVGTGGGKTLLAAAIVARLALPTLWLVTTRTLLDQTVKSLRRFLGVDPGVIGDGVAKPKRLTVGLVQSLPPDGVDLSAWQGGTLVFDEGHHAAADTWQGVVRRTSPRYHYYLSAVPFRAGEDQAVLDALAGDRLTGGRYSAQFLIERGYACPVEVQVETCRIRGEMTEKPFTTLYREFVVENPERNALVAAVARMERARGRSVLVLVEHRAHGRILSALLGDRADFVDGGTARAELVRRTEDFREGRLPCLVATAGLFQEGVSIDGIEVLIQAGGLKSKSKVIQSVGRGMRRAPGKDACVYVDFYDDDDAGILRAHARRRFGVLKDEGFDVPPLPAGRTPQDPVTDIPASWWHVPGTKRFLRVDGTGHVSARGECLRRSPVPKKICKRCSNRNLCVGGGRITWREDQE